MDSSITHSMQLELYLLNLCLRLFTHYLNCTIFYSVALLVDTMCFIFTRELAAVLYFS